jgi:hypothetical protein
MFLFFYLKKNCNHSFLNKFFYQTINELPKIKRILLSFKLNSYNLKSTATHFLVLQQLTNVKNGFFVKAKKSNLLIKVKKGNIIGCEFSIEKNKQVLMFLKRFILEILSVKQQNVNSDIRNNSIFYKISNIILLTKFDKFFNLYNIVNKSKLNLTITFYAKNNELPYILNKLKIA